MTLSRESGVHDERSDEAIQRAADVVSDAQALLVTAGAGMGVDSGLPDFRGNQGFWKAYPALGQRGLSFAEVASPFTFETDPALAWGFYGHRLQLYRRTVPHAGFDILKRWGDRMLFGSAVFTSNVDGQFQRAGFVGPISECHGSIHHLQCTRQCSDAIWSAEFFDPHIDEADCKALDHFPMCPHCGALARPNVLMFGDMGWLSQRSSTQHSKLQRWLEGAERIAVVELGAGINIPSVRHFSQAALIERNAVLVRINPREPNVPRLQDVGIAGSALATLRAIDARLSRDLTGAN
jgi:NAD-dependent SIR2 family protein deacetylase